MLPKLFTVSTILWQHCRSYGKLCATLETSVVVWQRNMWTLWNGNFWVVTCQDTFLYCTLKLCVPLRLCWYSCTRLHGVIAQKSTTWYSCEWFISLGFLFYICFIQKFAKTIFNSVILTRLIVFLSAISSFMCNHLLLKKNVPSISMPLYISTVYVCHFLLLLYVGGIYVFSTSAYTSKFQSSKSKPHYPISVMHITPNNVHTLPFFHIPICKQIFLCSYFLCTSLSLYIITPFFIIF